MRMDQPAAHVHYFNGKVPLVLGGASFQRKVRGFGAANAALEEAQVRLERQREQELEDDRRKDEEMERRRLALNADARDLVERRRSQNRRLQGDVVTQAVERKAHDRRRREEEILLSQAARFGTSVPAARDEGPDDARREARARQYKAELEDEIRSKAEALEAMRRERMLAEQEALEAERAQIVEGILRNRQEDREKREFEEAALSTQALGALASRAGGGGGAGRML